MTGDWYFPLLFLTSFLLGFFIRSDRHIQSGVLLALPALVTAWWTTNRGDNDGLWVLIFPMLGAAMLFTASLHLAGGRARLHWRR